MRPPKSFISLEVQVSAEPRALSVGGGRRAELPDGRTPGLPVRGLALPHP